MNTIVGRIVAGAICAVPTNPGGPSGTGAGLSSNGQ